MADEPQVAKAASTLSDQEIEKLILDNLGLAYHIAKTWKGNVAKIDDQEVESQAIQGLVKAANTYNPASGAFVSYAGMVIRNYLGHQKHWGKVHQDVQPGELDAAYGGEDDDESTLHDKVGDTSKVGANAGDVMSKSEAEKIIQAEIEKLPATSKKYVKGWMSGKSYREMQKGADISFTMIMHHVKAGLAQIKKNLETQGFSQVQDLWAESEELGLSGKQIYELLISRIEIGRNTTLLEQVCR